MIDHSRNESETQASARTPRQEEILDRALELVQERGLANLTLKKVAERVGFTEPAIYRHYAHKEALVFALVDRLRDLVLGPIEQIAKDSSLPPRARLERMVRHHVEVLRRTQGLPFLLIAEGIASGDDALLARLRGNMADYERLLVAALAEAGLPAKPPLAQQAMQFIGLPAILGVLLRANPDRALSDAEVDDLVSHYVRCLTTPVSSRRKTARR